MIKLRATPDADFGPQQSAGIGPVGVNVYCAFAPFGRFAISGGDVATARRWCRAFLTSYTNPLPASLREEVWPLQADRMPKILAGANFVNPRLLAGLVTSIALAACSSSGSDGSSGSGGSANVDTSDLAGLWDASEGSDGARDERYVSISAEGNYTVYDYRQDGLASEGNCYAIAELSLEPISSRDVEFGGNPLADADPIVRVDAPTYRLSDQRTVSLFVMESYTEPDGEEGDGSSQPSVTTRSLVNVFGEAPATISSEWMAVVGVSAADLESCETV